MYAVVLPLMLCVACVVTLIWINTISKPPAYEYEMSFNYMLIGMILLSGWTTWSLLTL